MLLIFFLLNKYDIRGNYSWLRTDQNTSDINSLIYSLSSPDDTSAENITGAEFTYKYNGADLTLGRLLKFGSRTLVRLGAGIGYADIKQTADNAFTETTITGSPFCTLTPCLTTDASFENKFKGLGPVFTMDGQYNFNRFFALIAGAALSGLYGKSEANLQGTLAYTDPTVVPNSLVVGNTQLEDDKIAVGLEGRVGLEYTPFRNDDVF